MCCVDFLHGLGWARGIARSSCSDLEGLEVSARTSCADLEGIEVLHGLGGLEVLRGLGEA